MKQSVINIDPEVMGGVPVFRGTRVRIQTLFDWLETETLKDFLLNFPSVKKSRHSKYYASQRSLLHLKKPEWKSYWMKIFPCHWKMNSSTKATRFLQSEIWNGRGRKMVILSKRCKKINLIALSQMIRTFPINSIYHNIRLLYSCWMPMIIRAMFWKHYQRSDQKA